MNHHILYQVLPPLHLFFFLFFFSLFSLFSSLFLSFFSVLSKWEEDWRRGWEVSGRSWYLYYLYSSVMRKGRKRCILDLCPFQARWYDLDFHPDHQVFHSILLFFSLNLILFASKLIIFFRHGFQNKDSCSIAQSMEHMRDKQKYPPSLLFFFLFFFFLFFSLRLFRLFCLIV